METRRAFPERISDERKNVGLTQDELASQLGISRQSITLYEKGARVPDIEVLRKFADFFDVTADYLLGLSDNRTAETAAIGDKLGLSDEAINRLTEAAEIGLNDEVIDRLSEATEVIYRPMEVVNGKVNFIYDRSEKGNFTRASAIMYLRTLNTICMDTELLRYISHYLENYIPDCILTSFREGDTDVIMMDVEEEKEIAQALNMYHVQKQLTKLREKLQKQKETTNAQKDKRQE